MDTLQAIRERRSVRRYRPEPIPEEDLASIIEAGHVAPSAANRQPCRDGFRAKGRPCPGMPWADVDG